MQLRYRIKSDATKHSPWKSREYFMKIRKYWFWEIPKKTTGIAIVIDAWAATTNIPILLSQKPKRLIITNEEKLFLSQKIFPDALTIGESITLPKETFSASNFPADIVKANFRGKTVLYMSSNGTKLIEAIFNKTGVVISCSFNNLSAVCKWFYLQKEKELSIIMAGELGKEVEEDRVCADILEKELKGFYYNWDATAKGIKKCINSYYSAFSEKVVDSLSYVVDRNRYVLVPKVFRNREGFLEINNMSP